MYIDQIIDSFNEINKIIRISEIKNFIFYMIIIIYYIYKGINLIF